jgi:ATP-binding cassette subfamily F protein 3
MIISLENISKSYAGEQVLDNIALTVEDKDRIGLVGINGCGKSTLLRIISGEEFPDTQPEPHVAKIHKSKSAFIGFLAQDSGLDGGSSVIDEMKSVKLREGEEYLVDKILNKMGFLPEVYPRIISSLSGGERTRLALAKKLLEEPELLILDEPTNHLDFDTLLWLEDYLKDYRGALLIVSHDRYFLDKLVTSVCEIERGTLRRFKGNYTAFTAQKAQYVEHQLKEHEAQVEEIAKLKDYVARNIVRASTTKMAQSRRKQLEKLEANLVAKPISGSQSGKSAKIRFEYDREPVKDVLIVKNLDLKVGGNLLAESLSLEIRKGERVAIVGANGSGKSTLLKVLQGKLPRSGGVLEWGDNVKISYFEQTNTEIFNESDITINAVHKLHPLMTELQVRSLLGSVRLTGDDVYKRVSDLSGGERAKLRMAIMTLEHGNVLILDEPTNHLDISTRDVLEAALTGYSGTILFVSHDRYLLNSLSTRILEVTPSGLNDYPDFEGYMSSRRGEPAASESKVGKPAKIHDTYRSKAQRAEETQKRVRVKALEDEIERLESLMSELQGELELPEVFANHELLQEKCRLLEDAKAKLAEVTDEWLTAVE